MAVLYIRDKDGNFIQIPSIKGADGKSAYEQAVEGGFIGTEEEFIAILNGILNITSPASLELSHFDDRNNPHKVTAEQTGALPIEGGVMTGAVQWNDGKTGIIGQSDGNVVIRNYKLTDEGNDDVLAFQNTEILKNMLRMYRNGVPYSVYGQHNKPDPSDIGAIPSTIEESDRVQRICTGNHIYIHNKFDADVPEMPVVSNFTHYVTLGADNKVYAVLSIPVDYTNKAYYYTAQDKLWHEIADGANHAKIATGSYVGAGNYGKDNPNSLTFDFEPKTILFNVDTDMCTVAPFIRGCTTSSYGVGDASESRRKINLTWNGNTVTWYANSASYQLNDDERTYYYVAMG